MSRVDVSKNGLEKLGWVPYRDFVASNKSVLRMVWRIYRRSESINTVRNYIQSVKIFTDFMGYDSADELLQSSLDWEAVLNDFIDHILYDRGGARNTVATYIKGVIKWLRVNGVKIDREKIEVPQIWIVERDRLPRKEELRKLFKYGDLVDKVIMLLGVSTGLRRGTIAKLKLGDVNLDDEIPVIIVRPEIAKERPSRGYITFMTPECKEYLLMYLEHRRMNGEKLNSESPLIGYGYTGRHLSPKEFTTRWRHLLKKAGLGEKSNKWSVLRFHTLRKYFKTWCTLAGIPGDIVESFMGHISGIKHVYFLSGVDSMENPEVIKILRKEYQKAIPHLTINIDETTVKNLEEELEELKRWQEETASEVDKLYKMVNDLIKYVKTLRDTATNE